MFWLVICTDNVRLARTPQSLRNQAVSSDVSDQVEIEKSPPNGHARQHDNHMEHVTAANEDQNAKKPIPLDSSDVDARDHSINGRSRKQEHGLDSIVKVDPHHSELGLALDSIGEDDEDIDVARILHSIGDDDDYEYEIDIDIEKTEYKFT